MLSPVVQIFSVIAFYLSEQMLSFKDYVYVAQHMITAIVPIFLQVSTKIFSKKLIFRFDVLDEEFDSNFNEIGARSIPKLGLSSFVTRFLHICCVLIPIPWLCNVLGIGGLNFHTLSAYYFPMPGINGIHSWKLYTFVYISQGLVIGVNAAGLFASITFVDILTMELLNEFTTLREALEANTGDLKTRLKSLFAGDLNTKIVDKEQFNLMRRQTEERKVQIVNHFEYNLVLCVQSHQKLIKLVMLPISIHEKRDHIFFFLLC